MEWIPASRQDLQAPTRVNFDLLRFLLFRFVRAILLMFHFIEFDSLARFCVLFGLANGNIFTIKAKTQAVSITSFDINMDGASTPQPAPIEIYFHPGIAPGFSSPTNYPYTKIFQDDVTGKGKGNVTALPDLTVPVIIPAGSTYSFYITVANFTFGTNIWYNVGVAVGDVVASDQYIEIGEGYALGYPFLGYTQKRRWNGEIIEFDRSFATSFSKDMIQRSLTSRLNSVSRNQAMCTSLLRLRKAYLQPVNRPRQ